VGRIPRRLGRFLGNTGGPGGAGQGPVRHCVFTKLGSRHARGVWDMYRQRLSEDGTSASVAGRVSDPFARRTSRYHLGITRVPAMRLRLESRRRAGPRAGAMGVQDTVTSRSDTLVVDPSLPFFSQSARASRRRRHQASAARRASLRSGALLSRPRHNGRRLGTLS
jgi:hypothetical protein